MMLPVKIKGKPVGNLKAEIVENNWGPYQAGDEFEYYRDEVYTLSGNPTAGNVGNADPDHPKIKDGPWNGFLSLAATPTSTGSDATNLSGAATTTFTGFRKTSERPCREKVWRRAAKSCCFPKRKGRRPADTGSTKSSEKRHDRRREQRRLHRHDRRGEREDRPADSVLHQSIAAGKYDRIFGQQPLFFIQTLGKGETDRPAGRALRTYGGHRNDIPSPPRHQPQGHLPPSQQRQAVQRMVLARRKNEAAAQYLPFESEGPWEAEIETGGDWIRINGVLGGRAKGATGSEIRFSYQPDGTIERGSMQVRDHSGALSQLLLLPPDLRSSGLRSRPNRGRCQMALFQSLLQRHGSEVTVRGGVRCSASAISTSPSTRPTTTYSTISRTMRRPSSNLSPWRSKKKGTWTEGRGKNADHEQAPRFGRIQRPRTDHRPQFQLPCSRIRGFPHPATQLPVRIRRALRRRIHRNFFRRERHLQLRLLQRQQQEQRHARMFRLQPQREVPIQAERVRTSSSRSGLPGTDGARTARRRAANAACCAMPTEARSTPRRTFITARCSIPYTPISERYTGSTNGPIRELRHGI